MHPAGLALWAIWTPIVAVCVGAILYRLGQFFRNTR